MSSKRARTHSDPPTDISLDSSETQVATQASSKVPRRSSPKSALKTSPNGKTQYRNNPLTCTLPPACSPPNRRPTFASSSELEQHYATYHTHVCTAPLTGSSSNTPIVTTGGALGHRKSRPRECGKVFPDARLLDLHLSEIHDPLMAIRQERGEKTFACFVPTCQGMFSSPKGRRLHLIDIHKYPKEYFFSVTKRGIGDLLGKWGQGASMIRGEWKPRPGQGNDPQEGDEKLVDGSGEDEKLEENAGDQSAEMKVDEQVSPSSDGATMAVTVPVKATSKNAEPSPRKQLAGRRDIPPHMDLSPVKAQTPKPPHRSPPPPDSIDSLAASMGELSIVPPSIRFGRGGRHGGFVGSGRTPKQSRGLVVDPVPPAQGPTSPLGTTGGEVSSNATGSVGSQPHVMQAIKAV